VARRFPKILKVLFYIAMVLYPAFIYYFLVIRKIPLRMFSLFIIAFALFAFIARTSYKKGETKGTTFVWTSLLLLGVGVLCFITNSAVILKFYPVLMNVLFLAGFGITCFLPPNMIFRFATMQDRTIKGSLNEKRVEAYCRKVTIAWCIFFVFNGSMAAWTIFSGSDTLWSVYNGGISYILMGTFFIGELITRKMVQKKMPKAVPQEDIKPLLSGEHTGGGGTAGFDSLEKITVIEKTENSVSLEFSIPDSSPYFDGHFPDFPILPAVAQVELVTRFALRYLGTGVGLSEIRRIKFTSLVTPGVPLLLKLVKKGNVLSFNMCSPNGETAYSTGTVILERE